MKTRAVISARSARGRLVVTAVAASAAGLLAWAGTSAQGPAGQERTAGIAPVAEEAPGYAVETFDYPGADRVLAEKKIVLKRGDGHITLAECATGTGQLEVWGRDNDKVCFRVTGKSGWLTLEIPAVYAIRGNDYTTRVDMTVGSEEKTFAVDENAWTPVGESADEQGRTFMLVEIRTAQ